MRTIDLAHPRLLSFDGFLLLVFLLVGTVGAVLTFTPPEPAARPAGGVILAVGLASLAARRVLRVGLDETELVVRVVTGRRRFARSRLGPARVVEGRLVWRLFGVGAPGYHTGVYHLSGHGRVQAYASRWSGPFVLVEREDGLPLVFSPEDPEGFVEEIGAAAGRRGPDALPEPPRHQDTKGHQGP